MRVLHLDHPLAQPDQVGSDSNGATRHLQENKEWIRRNVQEVPVGSFLLREVRCMSHHADCNNLLIGLRGFSSNHARTSQVLNPDTIVIPNDVGDDVPETDGRSDEDKYINIYLIYILSF